MSKVNRESIDRYYDYDIHLETRTIYLGSVHTDIDGSESGVEASLAERTIKALHILDQKEEEITIILNNLGGDWTHGMAIYDAIKACKSPVTIKVYGCAMSMGAVILQAADNRILAPNSRVMIHYGYAGMSGHSKTFQSWAKEFAKIDDEMEAILLEKIQEKNPTFTQKQLEEMLNFDTILNAQDAVKMGLADSVM